MPKFYYISFKYDSPNQFLPKRLAIKEFTDIKPLQDPHFSYDLCEIEFMLTGHWDMWVDMTLKDDKLVRVRKEVNCNVALDNEYPEMYILLTEFFAPAEPDDTLLPKIYEMEQRYWSKGAHYF
uniref:Uncharacterized protein n=1 Tax=Marseillevirus LCMAC202 TaxID=2506606 RepID=A0A481YZ53_9VIRU|nr:MAG: hypothetical protein LCMAC202_04770 [Marseillevirus LCMAC202]